MVNCREMIFLFCFFEKKHKTQKQLLLVWTWRSIRYALSPSVSNTFVTLSPWRRRVRFNDAFPSSPSPRMLPRRVTLNVLTHFSTPWICMSTKPQWSFSDYILYPVCIIHVFQCGSITVNALFIDCISISVLRHRRVCVTVWLRTPVFSYPTYSTWYYVSSVSEIPTSKVQNGGLFIAFYFVYS